MVYFCFRPLYLFCISVVVALPLYLSMKICLQLVCILAANLGRKGSMDTHLLALLYLIPRQKYFQSGRDVDTNLLIEWTNQHGCGGNEDNDPHKLNCNIVIQYMVQDYDGNQGGRCTAALSLMVVLFVCVCECFEG